MLQVLLIFGVSGACTGSELLNLTVDDIKKHSDGLMLVTVEGERPNTQRSFVIRDELVKTVEKYMELRPNLNTKRFFINYQNGQCTKMVTGRNRLGHIAGQIASYLKLPNPEQYTVKSLRKTSAAFVTEASSSRLRKTLVGSINSVVS